VYCPQCKSDFPSGSHCPFDGAALVEACATQLLPHDPSSDPLVGKVLDAKYQLISRLGSGSMAVVYRAQELGTGRSLAIKLLKLGKEAELVERFRREAALVSRLTSPNTVRVFDQGALNGAPWIAMELLDGSPLDVLLERGPLDARATLDILRQLCDSLEEAHALGVIHRDVKPANVFLHRGGGPAPIVKLLDFGIAKANSGAASQIFGRAITVMGAVMGTPTYLSPEQAADGPVDARADIYALGAVAYHCLAGRPPFVGPPGEVLAAQVSKPAPEFHQLPNPVVVPPAVADLVRSMLRKRPDERPATVAALRAEIDRARWLLDHPEASAPPKPEPARSLGRSVLAGAVAFGVVLALGGGLISAAERRAERARSQRLAARVPTGFVEVPLRAPTADLEP
jgi:serine/threonine protein kinase